MTELKLYLLKNARRLPPALNYHISRLNRQPGRVFGQAYRKWLHELKQPHFDWQVRNAQLLALVNDAIRQVPYYRERYTGAKLETLSDFRDTFGFIDKQIISEESASFLADGFSEDHYDLVTTGGTSGKPLQLYVPRDRYALEWATVHDAWSRTGYDFNHRAVLRNHRLPAGRIYEVNPFTKEIIFDNFRLTDDYMRQIYKVLRKYDIRFLHAYPSAAYQFAAFCVREGLDLTFMQAFLSSSENVYAHQVEFISRQAGVRMFAFYGHSEKLLFGACCERSDYFHMDPHYGYFELVDEAGEVITRPGETGEMVGTTLHNTGMPLIRYKTGDHAEYLGDHCPACGRRMPVLRRIMGRWNGDKVYNHDGSFVTTTALNLHDDLYARIDGLQYSQREKGQLEVRVIKTPRFTPLDEKRLLDQVKGKLQPSAEVSLRYVEQLEHKDNGKFLLLINHIQPGENERERILS